jgi:predicted nucleic acid-binding protein
MRRGEILKFKSLLSGGIVHVTSPYILAEVERVLVDSFGRTRQKAKVATRLVRNLSVMVNPIEFERVSPDPNDDPIVTAAVEGKADFLVSLDQKGLLVLGKYKDVTMVRDLNHIIGLSRGFDNVEDFLADLKK